MEAQDGSAENPQLGLIDNVQVSGNLLHPSFPGTRSNPVLSVYKPVQMVIP